MPRIMVDSDAEADALVRKLEDATFDMSSFFTQLEKARVLEISEREVWDHRFGLGLQHAPATVKARKDRRGYYKNTPNQRAGPRSPYFEWTGKLREAASKFTTISSSRATVDPDFNYKGKIEAANPFSEVVSRVVPDDAVWNERIIGPRFERELTNWLRRKLGLQ